MDLDSYLLVDKPSGLSTHSPDVGIPGFAEHLSNKLGIKLWVCHRLDKETSGAIIFAKSKEASALLGNAFESSNVKKRYVLVTDRTPDIASTHRIESKIEKRGDRFESILGGSDSNACTRFVRLSTKGKYSLWDAFPETGKPHQIRLHARDLGFPILGDELYSGSRFPRLMLHAAEITVNFDELALFHESIPAPTFLNLGSLEDLDYVRWVSAVDRRKRLFSPDPSGALRLIHREGNGLCADRFGSICWFYWYREIAPEEKTLETLAAISQFSGVTDWRVQLMENRGQNPGEAAILPAPAPAQPWTIVEHGLKYICKPEKGLSRGIFLDQRQNRKWVLENSKDKSVLNLFSYTGAFSLCAAQGGAKLVCSVDSSKAYLEWAKENFAANKLDPAAYEFWAADARYFLDGCIKRGRKFDLIICDPPSFSRSKEGTFRIAEDLGALVGQCLAVLVEGGKLLVSTNYENWTRDEFREVLQKLSQRRGLKVSETFLPDLDFEMPGDEPVMKSFFVSKL